MSAELVKRLVSYFILRANASPNPGDLKNELNVMARMPVALLSSVIAARAIRLTAERIIAGYSSDDSLPSIYDKKAAKVSDGEEQASLAIKVIEINRANLKDAYKGTVGLLENKVCAGALASRVMAAYDEASAWTKAYIARTKCLSEKTPCTVRVPMMMAPGTRSVKEKKERKKKKAKKSGSFSEKLPGNPSLRKTPLVILWLSDGSWRYYKRGPSKKKVTGRNLAKYAYTQWTKRNTESPAVSKIVYIPKNNFRMKDAKRKKKKCEDPAPAKSFYRGAVYSAELLAMEKWPASSTGSVPRVGALDESEVPEAVRNQWCPE